MKAVIREYNGGKYGRTGEYIADITPKYFKNGKMMKTGFIVNEVLEVVKKGYRATSNATHTESIWKVIDEEEA